MEARYRRESCRPDQPTLVPTTGVVTEYLTVYRITLTTVLEGVPTPGLQVIRPQNVTVYSCDYTPCGKICEDLQSLYPTGCGWVRHVDYDHEARHQRWERRYGSRRPVENWVPEIGVEDTLWFCSNLCLSRWAYVRACERGELDCTTPVELPRQLAAA